jgi:hypothetical protein
VHTIHIMKHINSLWSVLSIGIASACGGGAEDASSPVVLNEVMPSNKATCADEAGGFADWVELYNRSDTTVDVGGYSLTDTPDVPRKAVLPAGVLIAPRGVLTFWADKNTDAGADHLPFKLSAAGEGVTLFNSEGKQVDQFTWPSADPDVSFARLPDGSGAFVPCAAATCSKPNGASCTE